MVKNIFVILNAREQLKLKQLIILEVFTSILDIGFLALLLAVIHFYTTGGAPVLFTGFSRDSLLPISVFFLLFSLKNLLAVYVFKAVSTFTFRVASRISGDNLEQYLDGSYSDYVSIDSSVHTRKISQQPIEFSYYVLAGLQQVVTQLLLILLTVLAIILYDAVLFVLLLAILTPPVIFCSMLVKGKLAAVRKTGAHVSRQSIQYLQEALAGFVESNLYQRKNFFTARYHASQEKFNDFLSVQRVVQHVPARLIEIFAVFGLLVLVLISRYASGNTIQFMTIGAFMAAAYKIIPGIVKIMNTLGQVKTYAYTVNDLLQKRPVIHFDKRPAPNQLTSVTFDAVNFSYQNKPVLQNFSFTMKQGDFVGFSGTSGKGKTTIIHLLLGFLKPLSGKISINGEQATEIQRQQYWNRISYIRQQPFFIHDTAMRNVVLSEHEYDRQQFVRASDISGFSTFINGDATNIISENGKNISGGQRQRIALARALYKDFDLIILDEPFSEMDGESEHGILEQLKHMAGQGKMVLLITHNQSGLKYCNKTIDIGRQ